MSAAEGLAKDDTPQPAPRKGCLVSTDANPRRGIVVDDSRAGTDSRVRVRWPGEGQESDEDVRSLKCGFQLGAEVIPARPGQRRGEAGLATVVALRTIAGRTQLLCESVDTQERSWVPWQYLRAARGPVSGTLALAAPEPGSAERFRLRVLATLVKNWHAGTGALARLSIDPLPHQINLVHRILTSGRLNWMIADDVGLGKTIEVGMLLAALERQGRARRVLIVCPAGLTLQWKEELYDRFGLGDFRIFGRDFFVHEPREWRIHEKVIASMDQLKTDTELELLVHSSSWDLVIFDEAHRLTRRQFGAKYESSQRYELARRLRPSAEGFLLLTATPHQGMQDKFISLLELVRPDMREEFLTLAMNPEILAEVILRNSKEHVTDAEGNLIFRGKETHTVPVTYSPAMRAFDAALAGYIRHGYATASQDGPAGRAIGFTMTTYRKLAASSIAAIKAALERRRATLLGEANGAVTDPPLDERFEGEVEERVRSDKAEFYSGEVADIDTLLQIAERLIAEDTKLDALLRSVVAGALSMDVDKRILIFTEYRATQTHIATGLSGVFGAGSVHLLNGGMDLDERNAAIEAFESRGRFLISTEAGGEGINLQRRCHIMVNYDLPWNPMRLVQRVGRLYRYGQKEKVVVFNMAIPDSLDGQIMAHLHTRLASMVSDMAGVTAEFRPGLEDEILGQMSESLDVAGILAEAMTKEKHRTTDQIDKALTAAREAVTLERRMFEHVGKPVLDGVDSGPRLDARHVMSFAAGAAKSLGMSVSPMPSGDAFELRSMPIELRRRLGLKADVLLVTTKISGMGRRARVEVLDSESLLLSHLLDSVLAFDFGGHAAVADSDTEGVLSAAVLSWQNIRGVKIREDVLLLQIDVGTVAEVNSSTILDRLIASSEDGRSIPMLEVRKSLLKRLHGLLHQESAKRSNEHLHPDNIRIVGIAVLSGPDLSASPGLA